MAKLVDALCSGRSVRKDVLVRIQFWAPRPSKQLGGRFSFWEVKDDVDRQGAKEIQRAWAAEPLRSERYYAFMSQTPVPTDTVT